MAAVVDVRRPSGSPDCVQAYKRGRRERTGYFHSFSSTMSLRKVITLNTGATIPQIGLGTWLSKPHEVENAVPSPFILVANLP